jgi:ribonuclease Z
MLEPYDDDLALRREHTGATPIEVTVLPFEARTTPPAAGAVTMVLYWCVRSPYITNPYRKAMLTGSILPMRQSSSRATHVCALRSRCCRSVRTSLYTRRAEISAMPSVTAGTVFERIFSYHADTVELGAVAPRASLPHPT